MGFSKNKTNMNKSGVPFRSFDRLIRSVVTITSFQSYFVTIGQGNVSPTILPTGVDYYCHLDCQELQNLVKWNLNETTNAVFFRYYFFFSLKGFFKTSARNSHVRSDFFWWGMRKNLQTARFRFRIVWLLCNLTGVSSGISAVDAPVKF